MNMHSIAATQGTRHARWRRRATLVTGAASAALLLLPAAPAFAATGARWRAATEIQLPADAAAHPQAVLNGVACTGNGFCVTGGQCSQASGATEAVVATQTRGRWAQGKALGLPKNAAADPYGQILGVACASRGNCAAVGSYDTAANAVPLAAAESRGKWSRAAAVRLPKNAETTNQNAFLASVACAGNGACTDVGVYLDKAGKQQMMAAYKPARGRWGRLKEIAAPKGAAPDPTAYLDGVACTSARDCVAVGSYRTSDQGSAQAMAVVEVRGRWRRAVPAAAPANREKAGYANLQSVSCMRGGRCVVVGVYQRPGQSSRFDSMSLTFAKGRFGKATQITALPSHPGTNPALTLESVSCAATGACQAAGYLAAGDADTPATVIRTAGGKWKKATVIALPANAGTGTGTSAMFFGDACVGGHCTAVGEYDDTTFGTQPMAAWNG